MTDSKTTLLKWGERELAFTSDIDCDFWSWASEDHLLEIYIWESAAGWRGDLSVSDFGKEIGDSRVCVASGDSLQNVLDKIRRSWRRVINVLDDGECPK